MHPSSCDLCHRPALIHETIVRSGVVQVRRLCRAHGLKLWQDAVEPAAEQLANRSGKQPINSAVTIPPSDLRAENRRR